MFLGFTNVSRYARYGDYHGKEKRRFSSPSPLINEVAVLLLVSLLGWKFTLIYVVVGMAVGMLGWAFLDKDKGRALAG